MPSSPTAIDRTPVVPASRAITTATGTDPNGQRPGPSAGALPVNIPGAAPCRRGGDEGAGARVYDRRGGSFGGSRATLPTPGASLHVSGRKFSARSGKSGACGRRGRVSSGNTQDDP